MLHWSDKQTKFGLSKTPSESSTPLEKQIVDHRDRAAALRIVQPQSFSVPRKYPKTILQPIKPIIVDAHKALSHICVKDAFRERGVAFKSILQNYSILFLVDF